MNPESPWSFDTAPSAVGCMVRAARRRPAFSGAAGFPDLQIVWRGFTVDAASCRRFATLSELPPMADAEVPAIVLHAASFRLLLAMITHPRWPLPIWRALQVRNRLLVHEPVPMAGRFELRARTAAWRVLEKSAEAEVQLQLMQDGHCLWESFVAFHYPGRFGAPAERVLVGNGAPRPSPAMSESVEAAARWRMGTGHRLGFCRYTGDFNGVHISDRYARTMRFAAAFSHPQRVAAACLAHLGASAAAARTIDLWIKGPVYYGAELTLRRVDAEAHTDFGLWLPTDPRPALVGRLHRTRPGS